MIDLSIECIIIVALCVVMALAIITKTPIDFSLIYEPVREETKVRVFCVAFFKNNFG